MTERISNDSDSTQPKDTKSVTYTCRICGKPLGDMTQLDLALLKYFNMPTNAGIHGRCIGVNGLGASDAKANTDAHQSA